MFLFLVALVGACLPDIGMANDLEHKQRTVETQSLMLISETPVRVKMPFMIQATHLRAWATVYKDFLQVFDLEQNNLRTSEYVVVFYEVGDEIVINVGRDPVVLGARGLGHTVKYHVRKTDYKLMSKILGK